MKIHLIIFIVLLMYIPIQSQVFPTTSEIEPGGRSTIGKIREVSLKAEFFFKQGLSNLADNRRAQAGADFDKSVEVILTSQINPVSDDKDVRNFRECYNQLIETVYRLEFPSNQKPQIRALSAACGWNIENKLIDDVIAKIGFSGKADEAAEKDSPERIAYNSAYNRYETAKNEYIKVRERFAAKEMSEADYNEASKAFDKAQSDYLNATEKLNKSIKEIKDNPSRGFSRQKYEPSPLDDLAKPESTPEKTEVKKPAYRRPLITTSGGVSVVKAQSGDTVAKLAARHGASAVEVAKFNGLLPDSQLAPGREIRLPSRGAIPNNLRTTVPANSYIIVPKTNPAPGSQPAQLKDGKVPVVMKYFNENLHDPYSMRFVRWSLIEKGFYNGEQCWKVIVKYRAKNVLGAYVLTEETFFIINNKVVGVRKAQ